MMYEVGNALASLPSATMFAQSLATGAMVDKVVAVGEAAGVDTVDMLDKADKAGSPESVALTDTASGPKLAAVAGSKRGSRAE